uniref:Ty3-gypsy retrotransposon protein n=1 Tax=Heterorhabditis bacteriophora TaxID=37862 RepID=A0A1I7XRZ6_HETBA
MDRGWCHTSSSPILNDLAIGPHVDAKLSSKIKIGTERIKILDQHRQEKLAMQNTAHSLELFFHVFNNEVESLSSSKLGSNLSMITLNDIEAVLTKDEIEYGIIHSSAIHFPAWKSLPTRIPPIITEFRMNDFQSFNKPVIMTTEDEDERLSLPSTHTIATEQENKILSLEAQLAVLSKQMQELLMSRDLDMKVGPRLHYLFNYRNINSSHRNHNFVMDMALPYHGSPGGTPITHGRKTRAEMGDFDQACYLVKALREKFRSMNNSFSEQEDDLSSAWADED